MEFCLAENYGEVVDTFSNSKVHRDTVVAAGLRTFFFGFLMEN